MKTTAFALLAALALTSAADENRQLQKQEQDMGVVTAPVGGEVGVIGMPDEVMPVTMPAPVAAEPEDKKKNEKEDKKKNEKEDKQKNEKEDKQKNEKEDKQKNEKEDKKNGNDKKGGGGGGGGGNLAPENLTGMECWGKSKCDGGKTLLPIWTAEYMCDLKRTPPFVYVLGGVRPAEGCPCLPGQDVITTGCNPNQRRNLRKQNKEMTEEVTVIMPDGKTRETVTVVLPDGERAIEFEE